MTIILRTTIKPVPHIAGRGRRCLSIRPSVCRTRHAFDRGRRC